MGYSQAEIVIKSSRTSFGVLILLYVVIDSYS